MKKPSRGKARRPRPGGAGALAGGTLLLAEDDLPVRTLIRRFLEAEGYTVLEARDSHDALRLAAQADRLQALVTDVVMPGMDGKELARRLVEERPGLRVLFVSASADDDQLAAGRLPPGRGYLAKPFDRTGLIAAVRRLLA